MANCFVHNVRFYRPKPEAIYCMALHKKSKVLALSRSNASIELWNLNDTPYCERTICTSNDNFSIEGLSWFQDRLFSVGLHGLLIEYDVKQLSINKKLTVTGEAAFCLDISEKTNQIAVGTEQGYLNIFDIAEDDVLFRKFLDKQEGRILCLKYDHSGSLIISGGYDAIRIWNVETGHALHKMTTGRSEANKPTIVWCLEVTYDLTIISGDSRGKLSFWDGKIGVQIESYQSHRADILTLCLSEDQSNLYCSGVDSNIINFVKIELKGGKEKWVRSIHKKIHDHDVRSLIICNEKLYSGGTDGYLAMSYNQPKTVVQYPPILQNPCVTICMEAKCVLLRHPKHIEIWKLGQTQSPNNNNNNNLIPLEKEPKRSMILQRLVKNHNGVEEREGIIFASISADGQWIAYGTHSGLRVFQFIYKQDEIHKLLIVENTNDHNIHLKGVFSQTSNQLITALAGGILMIYDISEDSLSISQRLESKELTDTISSLITSYDGRYLAASDISSNIVVWEKDQKGNIWSFYCRLPKYSSPPTTMALHPVTSDFLVVYADNKIIEYNLQSKSFTSLSRNLPACLPENWSSRFCSIKNIFYFTSTNQIILHDDNSMMVIDREPTKSKKDTKRKKQENENGTYRLRVMKKYKHLVHMGLLSDNEIVAVEVNPLTLLEQLPPVLMRDKFGTK